MATATRPCVKPVAYGRPTSVPARKNIPTRPLRPLRAPPDQDSLPGFPSVIRVAGFTPTHTLETHIITAAFPRAPTASLPSFPKGSQGETKQARTKRAHECTLILAETKRRISWDDKEDARALSTVVNRFARREKAHQKPGVTLVMTHPNGMHKEVCKTNFS